MHSGPSIRSRSKRNAPGMASSVGATTPASVNIISELAEHSVTGVRGKARDATFTIECEALDGLGSRITGAVPNATISIQTDPQTSGAAATLSGTLTVSAVDGVWTFSGLSINKENASTMVLRVTCGATTDDTSAFCIYHPVFDTAPAIDSNMRFMLSLMNTVGPHGAQTLRASGSNVDRIYCAFDTTRYIDSPAGTNNPPMPAWNAPIAFGSDDFFRDESAAMLTAVNDGTNDMSAIAVCDTVDTSGDSSGVLLEISDSGQYRFGIYFSDYLTGPIMFRTNDYRSGGLVKEALEDHGIAENTAVFAMGVAPRNAALVSYLKDQSTSGDTCDNIARRTDADTVTVGGRDTGALFLGARDTTNPRIWLIALYNANEGGNVTAWRSALGTALGLSL